MNIDTANLGISFPNYEMIWLYDNAPYVDFTINEWAYSSFALNLSFGSAFKHANTKSFKSLLTYFQPSSD